MAAKETTPSTDETLVSLAQSIKALAEAQAAATERENSKFKEIGFQDAVFCTPWNPTGKKIRPNLKVKGFQNGAQLDPEKLHDEEIELFNQLKPGRYFGGKFEVVRKRDRSIDFRYANKTVDQRSELKSSAVNFAAMLKLVVMEQESRAQRRKSGEDVDEDY